MFIKEPTSYEKTALSDLQGAWLELRHMVVELFGFPASDRLLFHIDEAMSWESVRDLNQMKHTFLLVHNIAIQADAPEEIIRCIDDVRDALEEAIQQTHTV